MEVMLGLFQVRTFNHVCQVLVYVCSSLFLISPFEPAVLGEHVDGVNRGLFIWFRSGCDV